jgi:transcription antitermination factor NusG
MLTIAAPPAFVVPDVPHRSNQIAPPMLHGADCVAQLPRQWFVVHTQSQREKALAAEMVDEDLPYYLPLVRVVRRVRGERRVSELPLFSHYLFACGKAAQDYCRQSRHVLALLPLHNGDRPDLVDKAQRQLVDELSSLEIALYAKPDLEVADVPKKGQRVRVLWGPFEGMEGVTEGAHEAKGVVRVYVQISIMGRAVTMDVDRGDLETLGW